MIRDDILRVKVCVLKVGIHCEGCAKKVRKVLNKIEGVYQISIEKPEGKVTVTGQMDLETVFTKLKKAGKPALLWGATANPGVPSHQVQQLQLGGGDDQQPKGGAGAASSSGGGDAKMAMPQATPQQLREQLQQQLMQGMNLPPQLLGLGGKMPLPAAAAPPANPKSVKFNIPNGGNSGDDDEEGFEDDGVDDDMYADDTKMMKPMAMPLAAGGAGCSGVKKGGKGGANNGGKLNLGGADGSGKNGKGGAPGGANLLQPGQARKASGAGGPSAGVGGPMMGMGGMQPPQQAAMTTRPPNMMGGAARYPGAGQMGGMHPHMAAKGMQPGGVNGMQPAGGAGMQMVHPHMAGNGMQSAGVAGGMPMGHHNMAGNGVQPGAGGVAGMPAGGRPMGHPHMGGNNGMQPGGGAGSTLAPGFYHAGPAGGGYGGGMPYGSEMMQAAGNQNVYGSSGGYMPMMQQQPPQMMNGCYGVSQGYYGDHVHGGAGYYQQQMGYGSSSGYGYGGHQQPMPYPSSYYPRHPHDNMFSDENPNSYCSVM
ncbi:hypothetical protein PVAP13_8NG032100 [Panicum virgatum]|uniref:HMA domain-containing protein n=2 Tax=Panicum virgatum TaxID=38727 RepID=A0A8T0PB03_PANVG|nr:hypothetical protein PVAP13_8NG032100 [Panicum virgatum]